METTSRLGTARGKVALNVRVFGKAYLSMKFKHLLKMNRETEARSHAQELAASACISQRCSWGKRKAELASSFLPSISSPLSQKYDKKRTKISYFIKTSFLKAPLKAL